MTKSTYIVLACMYACGFVTHWCVPSWEQIMSAKYRSKLLEQIVGAHCGSKFWVVIMGANCGSNLWEQIIRLILLAQIVVSN